MADTRFLLGSTILFAIFGVVRILSSSPVATLRDAVQGTGWTVFQYMTLFGAVILFMKGWLGMRWWLAAIFGGLAVVAYLFASTGALF